jgi:hypothetical protein
VTAFQTPRPPIRATEREPGPVTTFFKTRASALLCENILPTGYEQALHELRLAVALVLAAPAAAPSLELLVNDRQIHPEGALVFGSLLYAVGNRDAAQFWWQFAAGGGNYTSATCLSLLHRSLGEFSDADIWRREAEELAERPRPAQRVLSAPRHLVPDGIWTHILANCHDGLGLCLPPALIAVIEQIPGVYDTDHPYVSHIPPSLVQALSEAGT